MQLTLFPKHFQHLSPPQFADALAGLGLACVDLMVRDGYWCRNDTLAADVPRFVGAMRQRGIGVTFATAGWSPREVLEHPQWLAVLADHGIGAFRMGYFRREGEPRAALAAARRELESIVPICQRAGVRGVYQVHHGFLVSSASAAWLLVRDLPPDAIGVMLDPGNQSFEGYEHPDYAVPLIGEYLHLVGVKDTTLRDGKRVWAPLAEGSIDWVTYFRALRRIGFTGQLAVMPEYLGDDPARLMGSVKDDVAFVTRKWAEATPGSGTPGRVA